MDGRPLSHPDLDRAWAAFVDTGITPVFHVANQARPFDEAWYGPDMEGGITPMSTVFIWTGAALAMTDLILNGVLERYPDLRIGIMELSARWVPLHLQMMDGGYRHTSRFNGESTELSAHAERVFPASGSGGRLLVRAAPSADRERRRHLHGVQRLSPYRRDVDGDRGLRRHRLVTDESSALFFGGNAAFLLREPSLV